VLILNQVFGQSSFEVGVTAGVETNFPSSFNPDLIKDYRVQPGFHLGFRLQHNFNDHLSLAGALEYGRMYFYKEEYPAPDPVNPIMPDYYAFTANQIRIPVLVQYDVGKSKSRFFFNTGICFLGSTGDYKESQTWTYTTGKYVVRGFPSEVVLPWNVGGIISAGYSYRISPKTRFFSELRFMIPLVANPGYSENISNTIRSLNLNLTIGFSFTTLQKQ
jgi:hypothetical protein